MIEGIPEAGVYIVFSFTNLRIGKEKKLHSLPSSAW